MKLFGRILLLIMLSFSFAACTKNVGQSSATQPAKPATPAFSHKLLDEVLAQYVNQDGWVDYQGLQKDRGKLDQYLVALATAKPQEFAGITEQLAFWINSYNAFTLADVLSDVYGKHKSVKEIEQEFFKRKTHAIAGEQLTLDQIEQKGRDLKDPRIHFALNCASASCPKLQSFAYNGTKLDFQLNKVAREFLGDSRRGMNYDPGRNWVYLSPIFKWYAADFSDSNALMARVKAEVSGADMLEVVKIYLPPDIARFLTEKKMEVKWMEYDWSLNALETHK